MKILKALLILTMLTIIAFAWYRTKPVDTNWITDHSEINESEIYGEMILEDSILRSERAH